MTCLNIAYITTTIALITYVNASEKLSSITSLSSSPLLAEYYRFHPKRIQCHEDNCLQGILQDEFKYIISHAEEPNKGAEEPNNKGAPDYDWAKTNLNDIESELMQKRGDLNDEYSYQADQATCACQTKYELLDLGHTHFPRYLINAVCQNRNTNSQKCCRGTMCKEIPYKVRVLTHRSESDLLEMDDRLTTTLPESLIMNWKFKTITVAVACQCAN